MSANDEEQQSHIVAISGGAFVPNGRGGARPSPLLRYVLDLTGQDRPKLCLLTTAIGDASEYLAQLYAAFSGWDVEVSHLVLFPMPNHGDPTAHLCEQDAVFVSGGSVANLLALWRLHGVDTAMEQAWRQGVVLSGQSAGSICWHAGGTTDSFGPQLHAVTDGLGFLPYGNGVHYDSEEQRRPLLHRLVAKGTWPLAYAADDGAALHYAGTEMVQAVSFRDGAAAYRVQPDATEGAVEERIEPRRLDP